MTKEQKIAIGVGGLFVIGVLVYILFLRPMIRESRVEQVKRQVEQTPSTQRLVEGNRSPYSGRECENFNKRAIAVAQPADMQARPLSGFFYADMVFEIPAYTASNTRFLGIYQCEIPDEIGAMRSARHDYIHVAKGLDAVMFHHGGSIFALELLKKDILDNVDCLIYGGKYCFRWDHENDPVMRYEDASHVTRETVIQAMEDLGYRQETDFEGYPFQMDVAMEERPERGTLRVAFAKPYDVEYEYDRETNSYVRYWNGLADKDRNNGERIAPKNIVVMIATSEQIDRRIDYLALGVDDPWALVPDDEEAGLILGGIGRYNNNQLGDPWFDTVDSGQAFYYMNGREYRGSWKKDKGDITSKLYFYDESGKEIPFVVGQVWVEILEPGQALRWTTESDDEENA